MTAAKKDGKALQGATSSLSDLTLHDGRKLSLKIGGAIQPTPILTRTMDGASSITIPVYDPKKRLLRDSLFSAKFDCMIDGLPFRYLGLSKSGKQLTITLMDRRIARLQEFVGPKRVLREPLGKNAKPTTRAEFIKSLFREALPDLEFYCPELHVIQPIKSKAQGKKAKDEAKENRGKGIGETKGLKVKGEKAEAEQREVIERALRVAESLGAPVKARIALVAAIIDESEARNTHSGTGTSVGCLQLTDEHGSVSVRLDIEHCCHEFLVEGFTGAGGAIKLAGKDLSPSEVAATVQGNEAGAGAYSDFVAEAQEWVEAFEGGDLSGSEEVTEPYRFEVKANRGDGQPEDYWEAGKRLAKEVNWRLFLLPTKAVFMDELDLVRGQVRLAIDEDTAGVEDVDFDFNVNKKVTEAVVTVFAAQWQPPPATVVTLADYGPASLGPGDPPRKANKKGQKPALSSRVKASTHEGKGRYLVSSITTPLTESSEARKAEIKLKRPTPPLPEPAPETKTVSNGAGSVSGSVSGNATAERMLETAHRISAKNGPYIWGGFSESGYDCSGFVSKELNVGGFLEGRTDTQGLAGWGEAGEGEVITVYVKTSGSAEEEHCAIKIGDEVFESGGGGENTNTNGHAGAGKVDPAEVGEFLKQFDTKRHPKGF